MSGLYAVEAEPGVRSWLARLSERGFGRVDFLAGLLAEQAGTLGEPYARHLGGKVRSPTARSDLGALDADLIVQISPHAA